MNKHEWAASVIGKPWRLHECGPDAFDCWGLVWHYYANVEETLLPPYQGMAFGDGFFQEVDSWTPDEDGVVLCCFANGVPHHIGVKLDNYVIHAAGNERKPGQVFRHRLSAFRRIYGDVRGYTLDLHKPNHS